MRVPWKPIRRTVGGLTFSVPVIVLLVFVARGCDTASVPNVHPPPGVTLPPEPATSAPVDLTGVQLAGVDGTTTVPAVPDSGTSHLSGSVNGPQGPVAGAVVRVEHLVNNRANGVDLIADGAGHWDLPNIAGGRYRARAFLAPSLAQADPVVFFLNEGDQRNIDLNVDQFTGGPEVSVAVAPDPPNLGQPTSVVVRVTHRTVDTDGVVRSAPLTGASVTFNASAGWAVTGASTAGTNENGDATFVVECRQAGVKDVTVTVRATPTAPPVSTNQEVSACIDPRSTSTTTTAPTGSSSTTTTAPKAN